MAINKNIWFIIGIVIVALLLNIQKKEATFAYDDLDSVRYACQVDGPGKIYHRELEQGPRYCLTTANETYCVDNGYTFIEDCQRGIPRCTLAADCGYDRYIGPARCSGNNIIKDWMTFVCNMPGTMDSYCSTNIQTNKIIQTCSGGCAVNSSNQAYCIQGTCNTPADTDCNQDVSDSELITYINSWLSGSVTDTQMIQAINAWL